MAPTVEEALKALSPVQRTMFNALKRRFSARFGLKDSDLLYVIGRMFLPPNYQRGKTILRAPQHLDVLPLIGAGKVNVICTDGHQRNMLTLQIASEGDAAGLPCLTGQSEIRHFGAVAHSQALVGLLTPDALEGLLERLDTIQRLRLLRYGWNASVGLLLEKRVLLSLPMVDRVWSALSQLETRFPSNAAANGQPAPLGLQLTQGDIGRLVGATRPTVNRKLKSLRHQGIISHRRGRYCVHRHPPFGSSTFSGPVPMAGSVLSDDLTRKEVLSYLRQQTAAIGLPVAAARAFAEHARLVVFPAGAQIGLADGTDALCLLVTGAARIECPGPTGDPLSLLLAKPGWLILGGLAPSGQAGFRAIAHVESCAAILTEEGLTRVVDAMTAGEFLHFLSFGWRVLSHHAWRTCQFFMLEAKERVWRQLTQLAHDFPARDVPACHTRGTLIDLDLSVADLAGLVEVNEAGVGRILRQFEADGLIEIVDYPRRGIVVRANPKKSLDGACDTNDRHADVSDDTQPSI